MILVTCIPYSDSGFDDVYIDVTVTRTATLLPLIHRLLFATEDERIAHSALYNDGRLRHSYSTHVVRYGTPLIRDYRCIPTVPVPATDVAALPHYRQRYYHLCYSALTPLAFNLPHLTYLSRTHSYSLHCYRTWTSPV